MAKEREQRLGGAMSQQMDSGEFDITVGDGEVDDEGLGGQDGATGGEGLALTPLSPHRS